MAPKDEPQQNKKDEKEEETATKEEDLVWYFAIGSMMHPDQCKQRNFVPIQSRPAKLLDFTINFFGPMGVAEALPDTTGGSMHGVLHQVTKAQMVELDQLEMGYLRKEGIAIPYNGEQVTATVYCRSEEAIKHLLKNPSRVDDKPPTQRYLELLIAGATHWRVDADYIDMLQQHPMRTRKSPSDYLTFTGSLDTEYHTIPEDDEKCCYVSLNGKVVRYSYPPDHRRYQMTRGFKLRYGPHVDLYTAGLLYDVKYGAPERLEDFTREHSAYIEDLTVGFNQDMGDLYYVQVIGKYTAQTWVD